MKRLLLIAAIAMMALTACTTVPPGHVGIIINNMGTAKGVNDLPTTTGFTFYNPVSTTVFTYPTNVQNVVWTKSKDEGHPANEEITFTNKDNMAISVDVSLSYSLEPKKVPAFYVKFRSDDLEQFTHGYLRNTTRDSFNETGGKYTIDQIMGDNSKFLTEVKDKIAAQIAEIGVHVEQFGIIGAPRPPVQVTDAINAKLQATQIAIQKENEVRQAEADAKKAVATAEGGAQAHIAEIQGEARAKVAIAEAEAKANQIRAASITPTVLEWERLAVQREAIKQWDGKQPQTVLGKDANMLIQLPGPKQ